MLASFRHRGLKRLFEQGDRSGVSSEHLDKIENILALLDRATEAGDLDLPGFRLHPLKGNLKGSWAVTVRANWRVVFRLDDGNVTEVDLVDYH
ncbi:MAG: type II toxin-antitoxin system RelE/ParE family toxin [Rhizobiales bacterium]|jgi:proteic killer suppression protein|nr:type II toxin-antitoxin system RelE/ParE family toxin [Hyphomicrobiales bacterium]